MDRGNPNMFRLECHIYVRYRKESEPASCDEFVVCYELNKKLFPTEIIGKL